MIARERGSDISQSKPSQRPQSHTETLRVTAWKNFTLFNMSTRTPAIAEDFPHFEAWYGKTPDFSYLKSHDKFHCRDEWFKLRQLTDMRYYAHFQYAESENYNLSLILSRIEDINRCRKIKALPLDKRPEAYKKYFEDKQLIVNDVWKYKEVPRLMKREQ